ncbi:serine--tRNA ligase [Rhodoplanes elegans]|uniref:Serine--tRNA ligase n=1 Tax=Rhodoplanes elegans TaxID=29408 RepID=A0A327K9K6_9BRAD|nr:serine--tRNA ligase [Rhodoplanes elegans]MBK5962328.1 serine--tRNA ligase [Rhodoplanes elegans]RAI34395.1 serine--tRNA ligase [Rhodoplanes elegans]
MYDIKWIRENRETFDRGLQRRNLAPLSAELFGLDDRRRAAIQALEAAQARRNAASKEIGEAKKRKDEAAAKALMDEVAGLKTSIPAMEAEEKAASAALDEALAKIPNTPLDAVPDGADEHGNVEHHRFGAPPVLSFTPRQHFELGEGLKQMDFEAAARLSGARFVVLKSKLARLERALAQFMLDLHTTEHGYTEVSPPLLVRDDAMFGTAQLPKFEEDQFEVGAKASFINNLELKVREELKALSASTVSDEVVKSVQGHFIDYYLMSRLDRRWLIPTAEVPLTNLVREQILDEAELPLRLTAGTYCFRAEAGAAGRDTRGMIRQHQFYKVELVSITTPEKSLEEHERMLACAEEVLRRLGLHYRVVTLCTGDMGFASQKTYDIEVWLPGQGMFREISSCSVCGDFQARRMSARYRTAEGRAVRPVHTLNGSGVAVGRAMIAVMENYQQADGSIAVPDVLQPYMGGLKEIRSE